MEVNPQKLAKMSRLFENFGDDMQEPSEFVAAALEAISKREWEAAIKFLNQARQRKEDDPNVYLLLVKCLPELDRTEEIEATLSEAAERFPADADVAIRRAWAAHDRDWSEAIRRWRLVAQQFPGQPTTYVGLATALRSSAQFDQADRLLEQARQQFPENLEIAIHHALIAHHRGSGSEALRRFSTLKEAFPNSPSIDDWIATSRFRLKLESINSELSISEEGRAACEPPESRFQSEAESDASPAVKGLSDARDLMFQFESLGDNCEFGIVQRRFGAEPLGLLRWTNTPPEHLIAALENRFEGVGEPKNTILSISSQGEYVTCDTRWEMVMHTFVYQHDAPQEQFYAKLCNRLKYLKEKLLVDLCDSEKVFVYKCASISEEQILRLHRTVRHYGRNTVLCVTLEDSTHPNELVEKCPDNLLRGYIKAFAPSDQVARLLPESCTWWLALCQRALENLDRRVP